MNVCRTFEIGTGSNQRQSNPKRVKPKTVKPKTGQTQDRSNPRQVKPKTGSNPRQGQTQDKKKIYTRACGGPGGGAKFCFQSSPASRFRDRTFKTFYKSFLSRIIINHTHMYINIHTLLFYVNVIKEKKVFK